MLWLSFDVWFYIICFMNSLTWFSNMLLWTYSLVVLHLPSTSSLNISSFISFWKSSKNSPHISLNFLSWFNNFSSTSNFRLSDCNWNWTQNHLIRNRTLKDLAKLAKWLSCVLTVLNKNYNSLRQCFTLNLINFFSEIFNCLAYYIIYHHSKDEVLRKIYILELKP